MTDLGFYLGSGDLHFSWVSPYCKQRMGAELPELLGLQLQIDPLSPKALRSTALLAEGKPSMLFC